MIPRRTARRAAALALCVGAILAMPAPAAAQRCPHVVVFTLPGVTWGDVERARPPALLSAARAGALGSVSVRTNRARTSYASGYATLGAGARVDAPAPAGGPSAASAPRAGPGHLDRGLVSAGLAEMKELAAEAGYRAVPGLLGSSLRETALVAVGNADAGTQPALPVGLRRWTLLAAMDATGRVDLAATGAELLQARPGVPFGARTAQPALRAAIDDALAVPCSVVFVDQGDLARVDAATAAPPSGYDRRFDRTWALLRADEALSHVRERIDPRRDLLLVVSPTSPAGADEVHLGVAVALGPGFPAGTQLGSATTRRPGLVTLPDVAPTVLAHLQGRAMLPVPARQGLPAEMSGNPWKAFDAQGARLDQAVALDAETVFVDGLKSPTSTAFVVVQVLVYAAVVPLVARRARSGAQAAVLATLAFVAFPASTYLAGVLPTHRLGTAGFVAVLVALDAALVAAAVAVASSALGRLLALSAITAALLMVDLVSSATLQLNTVLGYSPTVAGRFAGVGNVAFAVLGASALLTGALVAHLRSGDRRALAAAAILYVGTVVVDGAPAFGGDVGGTLALVPSLGATWLLLAGRRPGPGALAVGAAVAVAAVGLFLALDLARPPEARTHLARLFTDVSERGAGVLWDAIERKARSNLDVFRSSVYTLFVPPGLALMAWLLRRPRGRWQRLARDLPYLRAALVGGLLLAVLGFAVNDSGIVIPAVVLSFLIPLTLLVHLGLDEEAIG